MVAHADISDMLGAWALDGCSDAEAAAVEAHLAECADCTARAGRLRSAVGWLGVDRVRPAPAGLRGSVLAAARAARPPVLRITVTNAYAEQVALLDAALGELSPADWHRADPRHRDVRGVLGHLAGNDAALAAELGVPLVPLSSGDDGPAMRAAWRTQAASLLTAVTAANLDQAVRLTARGRRPVRTLGDALVQRAFETWTHRDDIGAIRTVPPPEQIQRIVKLTVALLPGALRTHGAADAGRAWRLVLRGPGGGDWTVPADAADVDVTIGADAAEFIRLVANRRPQGTLPHTVTGDGAFADAILRAATTLGCD